MYLVVFLVKSSFRLLNYLQSDLDVLLMLESQYNCNKLLLGLQTCNVVSRANYKLNQDNVLILEDENEAQEDLINLEIVERAPG